jgi:tRNA dimethylallyltransferase
MEILSQAPDEDQRKTVAHHLVAELSPASEYNASIFSKKAARAIKNCRKRDKIPVVTGGSGLYVKALLDGIFEFSKTDLRYRKYLGTLSSGKKPGYLYERLKKVDPETASGLHPNDKRRIIRALEVYKLSGKKMSEHKKTAKGIWGKYDITLIGLAMEREELYKKIDERVDKMFKQGIINEVRRLRGKKLSRSASQALGIKEISGFLKGEYSKDEASRLLKQNTRHFAKKQIAWFKPDSRIEWLEAEDKNLLKKVLRKISKKEG